MLIQAALNGSRSPVLNPAIPFKPESLASEAKKAVASGAASIHFHVYDIDAHESIDKVNVHNALSAIRAACPGIPVGISMGPAAEFRARQSAIASWSVLPDFVAVNFRDPAAGAIVECLLDRGMAVEAGILCLPSAQAYTASGVAHKCLRIIIEPLESTQEEAIHNVLAIENELDSASCQIPRMLHGTDNTAWSMLPEALVRCYDTRIGFEDSLNLPDGNLASNNGELVAAVVKLSTCG